MGQAMSVNADYDKFRNKARSKAAEGHFAGAFACGVLALLSFLGTYYVITSQADPAVVLLCEAATLFLIITLGVTLFTAYSVGDKPADLKSIRNLTMLIDGLGSDQGDYVAEVSSLLSRQKTLYQYQVEALQDAIKNRKTDMSVKQITDKIRTLRKGLGM